jgi:hypothetical protein
LKLSAANIRMRRADIKTILLASIFVSLVVFLIASIFAFGWRATWESIGIPTMSPFFADLRTIQGAISTADSGLNPQTVNPGDPWARTMNYPLIWLEIGRFFRIQEPVNFLFFGSVIVGSALVALFVMLVRFKSVFLLLMLVSGSTLLALERGNNDLIVFALLTFVALSSSVLVQSLLVLATALKLYPIAAMFSLKARRNQLLVIIAFQIAMLIVLFPQLAYLRGGNTASGSLSFGFSSIGALVEKFTREYLGLNLTSSHLTLVVAILSFATIFILHLKRVPPAVDALAVVGSDRRRLFLAGAGVYCASFTLSSNWDYRLIFLVLCYPFLMQLQSFVYSKLLPAFILTSLNYLALASILPDQVASLLVQASKLSTFILLMSLVTTLLLSRDGILSMASKKEVSPKAQKDKPEF